MKTKREELIDLQRQYIQLLKEELDSAVGIAWVHGWRSQNVDKGEQMRLQISESEKSINSNAPTESRNVATHEDKKEHLKGQQGCHSLKCLHPSQKDCEGCDAYF